MITTLLASMALISIWYITLFFYAKLKSDEESDRLWNEYKQRELEKESARFSYETGAFSGVTFTRRQFEEVSDKIKEEE